MTTDFTMPDKIPAVKECTTQLPGNRKRKRTSIKTPAENSGGTSKTQAYSDVHAVQQLQRRGFIGTKINRAFCRLKMY
jgi:hypothetical protein